MRYQKKHDFPFGILDVADILRLNIRRRLPDQVYADCPFCSDRRGKMNLNLEKTPGVATTAEEAAGCWAFTRF